MYKYVMIDAIVNDMYVREAVLFCMLCKCVDTENGTCVLKYTMLLLDLTISSALYPALTPKTCLN